jgi:hypothetical protein
MTATAIREKLHNYIDEADDKELKMMLTILEVGVKKKRYEWSQDESFVAELDERSRRLEEGIDKGRTWEEVKNHLQQLRKERTKRSIV